MSFSGSLGEVGGKMAGGKQALTLAAASLGFAVVQLDVTIVNVALNRIGAGLGAEVAGLQWVVDAYTLVLASLLLNAGAISDRFGAKRIFMIGFGLFTAASLGCGGAPGLGSLILARSAQGVGAALLLPCSLAVLNHAYPEEGARAKAVGIWAGVAGVAVAGGPLAGGMLVEALGWRSIFFVNLPIGLAGLLLTARFVAEVPQERARSLDWPGQAAAITAVAALTACLVEGPSLGWHSAAILGLLAAAAIAGSAFLAIERRAASPMLPLGLFRSPTFSGATALGFLISFVFYGFIFVLSLELQKERGLSPLATGFAFLPITAVVSAVNLLAGRIAAQRGVRLPILAGLVLDGLGFAALLLLGPERPYGVLVLPFLAIGAGISLVVPPMTSALLGSVGKPEFGIASGTLNASRQLGAAAGVAVFGSLIAGPGSLRPGLVAAFAVSIAALSIAIATAFLSISRRPAEAHRP